MQKLLIYLLGSIVSVFGSLVWAQAPHHHPHHNKAEQIAAELKLNEEQAQQLRDIMHKYKAMMREKRAELQATIPTPEQLESFHTFHRQMRDEIRGLLSDEKYREFLEHSFDHRRGHHHHDKGELRHGPAHFGDKAERMAGFWAKELGLSEQQKQQLQILREKRMEEMQQQDFDPHSIRKQMREDLKSVLTPEQRKRYKEIEKAAPGPAWKQGSANTNIGIQQPFDVSVFPNPTRGPVQIRLSNGTGNINLRILDMNGRVIEHRNFNVTESIISADLTGNPAGIYTIELSLNGQTTKTKVSVE